MSTGNPSEDTLNNEGLSDEGVSSVVADLQKQLEEAKELAAKKAEEARKANYKIESDEKFTKTVESLKSDFDEKISGLTKVLGEQLAQKDAELEDIKKILSSATGQTANITSAPIAESPIPTVDAAKQSKYDGMFGITR